MSLHNGNNNLAQSQKKTISKPVGSSNKVKMNLQSPMIGRIHNTPAGCGGCGK